MLRRFIRYPENFGGAPEVSSALMLAANSGLTSSSASSERIQSLLAFSSDEFFCRANPFHGSTKTFAPNDRASSTVASVLPESTSTISSAMSFTLFSVRAMFASSFKVMMQTERVMRRSIAGQRSVGHLILSSLSEGRTTAGHQQQLKTPLPFTPQPPATLVKWQSISAQS